MIQTVLVVDDESTIQKMLKVSLESEGYKVLSAKDGATALIQTSEQKPDIVILDLGLPDMSGLEVLKRLREWSRVPVIVLTVSESDEDKVNLLDAGADDYLTKPFSLPELFARLRVAMRYRPVPGASEPNFKAGSLEVDFAGHVVKVNGTVVKLTATEFQLLRVLVQNAGKVVTQRQLLKEVWGPNSVEHSHYLRVYVLHLRQKLGHEFEKMIVTESGVGYRLVASDIKN
jgi:two-component system KDP operon response regulator KdpE